MFIPPWFGGVTAMLGMGGDAASSPATVPAPETPPTPPAPEPLPEVPTLAEAVAELRREVRNSLALQPKGSKAPPPIIVVNYVELNVALARLERLLADQEVTPR